MIWSEMMEKKSVKVICEDTDVFVLLFHCYDFETWEIDLYMADFTEVKNTISIKDPWIVICTCYIRLWHCTNVLLDRKKESSECCRQVDII